MGVHNDWIAVGPNYSAATKVKISSVQDSANRLILSQPINRKPGDFVWLWKDSDGTEVLLGVAPDIGAFEHGFTIFANGYED